MAYSIDIIFLHHRSLSLELTVTEKRIAQFILDDVAAAAELPIAEIARLTNTSRGFGRTRFPGRWGAMSVS